MKCTILHEGKGRMRVHVENVRMTLHRADVLEAYLNHHDAIVHAAVYERTGDVVITYTGKRTAAIAILAGYKFDVAEYDALVTSADSRRLNREYQDKMFDLVAGRCLRKLFLPAPLDAAYTAFRSIRFLWKGVRCVLSRRLEVEVLDALSIGVSLLRGDFGTAGSVMFLLNLGSLLEEWTRKKSLDDLARSMALNVDKVWVRSQGTEVLVPLTKVRSGDEVVVRSGNMIPLDGTVLEGEAMVNQAALTGEAMPVRKAEGSTLYAGTVVEEGECVFIAKAEGGSNRYDKIVAMIEESEKLKSSTENRALVLADKLVPWCLGATVVTYLLTRNATRAISCLMVDFSGDYYMTVAYLFGRWQVEKREPKKPAEKRFKSLDDIRAYNKMLADQRKAAKAAAQQDKPQQTSAPSAADLKKAADKAKREFMAVSEDDRPAQAAALAKWREARKACEDAKQAVPAPAAACEQISMF